MTYEGEQVGMGRPGHQGANCSIPFMVCRVSCGMSGRSHSSTLIDYIPSAVMIPQRRFSTLLHQARAFQRQQCIYHNSPPSDIFSLYSDHRCNKADFPRITTTILEVHSDEVWNIEWSHDGNFLASASKDKSAIIWKKGVSAYLISIPLLI